jgi:hypothetical protein
MLFDGTIDLLLYLKTGFIIRNLNPKVFYLHKMLDGVKKDLRFSF